MGCLDVDFICLLCFYLFLNIFWEDERENEERDYLLLFFCV